MNSCSIIIIVQLNNCSTNGGNMAECKHNHCCEDCHEEENLQVSKIVISVILLVFGLLLGGYPQVKIVIFLFAYLLVGFDIISEAVKNILHGEVFDENFLMSIATIGAFCIKEYPEAIMVMVLYQLGEYFQHRAVEKSRQSITQLMDIRPDFANVIFNDEIVIKTPENVKIDDTIIVKTGEKIPLDGIVIEGSATIDVSALTGESAPKKISVGDNAISGSININGVLKIKVTKLFQNSTVSKILELVQEVAEKKSKSENFISKFAKIYTPIVVFLAVLLIIIPTIFFNGVFSIWFQRALTFLVISCPCAFVIAIPLSFFAGIGGASKCGILIKGSNYIEQLSKVNAVFFDKTGTLTKGAFRVVDIIPNDNCTKDELLKDTAYVEYFSSHPIAISIKQAFGKEVDYNNVSNLEEFAGLGLKATIDGYDVIVGNEKLMNKFNIEFEKQQKDGTIVYVAKDDKYLGAIIISDEIKEDVISSIELLKKIVKFVAILTGDVKNSADYIAKKIGIVNVYSNLLPIDKVKKIEECIKENKTVMFVGDGINDAPVIMRADVGVAMGALGSDAAIESADVVIMDDRISKIPMAIKISKKTMSIVWQNIIFALGVKILFLILGALGYISMWGAVFADVGVTLVAILNALRSLQINDFITK